MLYSYSETLKNRVYGGVGGKGEVLVVGREWQALPAKAAEGAQGTLESLRQSVLASDAHSHLVFGTVVWKLVGHFFLSLFVVDSTVPQRWREPPTLVEMAA